MCDSRQEAVELQVEQRTEEARFQLRSVILLRKKTSGFQPENVDFCTSAASNGLRVFYSDRNEPLLCYLFQDEWVRQSSTACVVSSSFAEIYHLISLFPNSYQSGHKSDQNDDHTENPKRPQTKMATTKTAIMMWSIDQRTCEQIIYPWQTGNYKTRHLNRAKSRF